MKPKNSAAPARPSFARAFLPFWITACLSGLVFCANYHHRHAPLTFLGLQVPADGLQSEEGFTLMINGKPHNPTKPVTLGSRTYPSQPHIPNRIS